MIAAAALLCCAAAVGEEGGDKGKAIELPHAGISLTLPAGYVSQLPGDPYVLEAGPDKAGARARNITLTLVVGGEKATVDSECDEMISDISRNPIFTRLQILKRVEAKVAGQPGKITLLTYTHRGDPCIAAVAIFMRDLPEKATTICYVLSAETLIEDQNSLLPALEAVIKSVRITDVQHPSALPAGELGQEVADPRAGYAIRPPHGWSVVQDPGGLVLVQRDYLLKGEWAFMGTVQVAEATPGATGKSYIEQSIAASLEQSRPMKVVESAPAKLGRFEGHQVVLHPDLSTSSSSGPASRPASQPAPPAPNILVVHRAAHVPGKGRQPDRIFSLKLICRGAEAEKAVEIMDKLASGFSVVEIARPAAETRPAETRPAERRPPETQPAETKPAETRPAETGTVEMK